MLTLPRQKVSFSPKELTNKGSDTLIIVASLCGFLIHMGFTGLFLSLMLWPMALLNTFVETDRSGDYASSTIDIIFFSNIPAAGFSRGC